LAGDEKAKRLRKTGAREKPLTAEVAKKNAENAKKAR
jgi:hypothetical protein